MKRVGLVGWRGMVGSVLLQRIHAERDFALMEPVFFSTSRVGELGPFIGKETAPLKDAKSVRELAAMDIVVSCQGSD
ncbi:MAG TPA: aspartate-semialdehyde dehydrogenase, partial [Burkholderiales bacterium]|nr:aspartate-semialdehyde dehydrogenase [Burkholderiales bacterium]